MCVSALFILYYLSFNIFVCIVQMCLHTHVFAIFMAKLALLTLTLMGSCHICNK